MNEMPFETKNIVGFAGKDIQRHGRSILQFAKHSTQVIQVCKYTHG